MKYDKHRVEKICKLVATGDYTVAELCQHTGVSEGQYYFWKANKPEFAEALRDAEDKRLEVYRNAARIGLLTLLRGKEFEETTTEWVEGKPGANGEPGKPKIKGKKTVKKFILPNPTSIIFALKNLDSERFRDVMAVEETKIHVTRS